jgi:hypothetical protein
VRTLRELGFGLDVTEAVLSRATTVAEDATAHVAAQDAEIRTLRLRRAVLSAVAKHGYLPGRMSEANPARYDPVTVGEHLAVKEASRLLPA